MWKVIFASAVILISEPRLLAQEGTDQLKTNSDKAQQVFDNSIAKSPARTGDHVEVMPVFPGGEQALYAYLKKEAKYPKEARQQGITGKVFVQFIVRTTGKVDSVIVKRGTHPLLDAEAAEVVDRMPNWTPGKIDGKPVPVQYVLPISFTMDAKDLEKIRKKQAKQSAKEKD